MKRLLPSLLACFAFATAALAADAPAGFTRVKSHGAITEYKLAANDLAVLLLEDHSAPVLTLMVTYRVGSRNEVTGTTGATHLLEHLMFKGSKNFHPGVGKGFDTLMDSIGGINNATTSYDRTNYYENLPADHLDLALQLEADRVRGLLLREEDRQPEMTVVRNEFERDENDPGSALFKEVGAAAFIAHPYHHPVIGWRSDIEKVSIEKLREFYDTFYWPNNATVTIIGDFKSDAALTLIGKYFGAIPKSPKPIPQVYTEEPAQSGARRVVVKRPGELGVVDIAFKVPPATHADFAAREVLGSILSDGKNSRLYRALIDPNLAINANAGQDMLHDASLFHLTAMLAPGTAHEQAEKTLLAEIEKIVKEGVTAAEVSRAANQLLAGIAYRRDGSFAIASQVNEPIAVGDWTLYYKHLDNLKAVTPEAVHAAAKAYLKLDQSTTGWFIPQEEAPPAKLGMSTTPKSVYFYREPGESPHSRAGLPASRSPLREQRDNFLAQNPNASSGGAPAGDTKIAANVRRRAIAGIDVTTLKTSIQDVVTIRGVVNAGDVFNPKENSAIADLAAGMLDKGTQKRDKFTVAGVLEQIGATLSFGTGSHTLNFSAKCLRKDLPVVMELLAEQLRTPRFDPEEFAKFKKQLAGRFKRNLEDTDFRGENAFARAVFPEGHPNRPPAEEKYLADIESATLEQVKAFHAANYGPTGARIIAVGDVDDAALDAKLREAFAGWQGGRALPAANKASLAAAARTEKVNMPGKTSVSLVIGQPSGLRYTDADYLNLNMATSVLGSGFFSARLLDIIRNQEGLTYGIGAGLGSDTYADGSWSISATFAPELLEKGTASTLRELKRFYDTGLTAQELATFKVTLTGSYKVALSTTSGIADRLLSALQRGYGPEWLDEFPRRLQALTLEQVNGSIKKHLHPDKMVTVLAGTLPEAPKK